MTLLGDLLMLAGSDPIVDVCYRGHIHLQTPIAFELVPSSLIVINPAMCYSWAQLFASEEEHGNPALIDFDVDSDPRTGHIRNPVVLLVEVYPWPPTFDFSGYERIERVVGICTERPWLVISLDHIPDWIRAAVKKRG